MIRLFPSLYGRRCAALGALVLSLPAGAVEFEKDVLPILRSKCYKCHDSDEEKGDLNLEPDKISKHIGSSEMIRPGNASGSRFIKAILSEDPDVMMPPKGSRLSSKEIDTLKLWIARGAELAPEPDPNAPEPLEGTWTNTDGKEIEATLLRVEGDMAVLELKSGTTTRYPIAKLSAESQAKVKEFAAKTK